MNRSFGEFDTKFLGVSLDVSSERRLDLLARYAWGPDNLTGKDAARLPDDDFFERVSCLTVLAHELRHFHDYIISIHGSRMMHARCVLAYNIAGLFGSIRADKKSRSANILPAPLSAWCRMPVAEREEFLAGLTAAAGDGRTFTPPRLPFLSAGGKVRRKQDGAPLASAGVAEAVEACWQSARRLDDLQALPEDLHRPRGGMEPVHVWEASAALVQFHEIAKAAGAAALSRFTGILAQGPGRKYTWALNGVNAVFRTAGIEAEADLVLQFILWCLLGDTHNDGRYASPLVRFAQLGNAFIQHGSQVIRPSMAESYELWDHLTGRAPTLGALIESLDRDRLFCEYMTGKLREDGAADEDGIRSQPVQLLGQFAAARRHLVSQLMADPDGYCSPQRYLQSLGRLSSPPVKIVVRQGAIEPTSPAGFTDDGWYLYAGKQLASAGTMVGLIVGPPVQLAGPVHVKRGTAFGAYTNFTLSDILFGPDIVDVPESDWESTDEALLGRDMSLIRVNR